MGNTTTKADLVNVIAHKTGLTKNETESIVDSLFESIIDSLKAGKRIEIRGFGSFNIRYKIFVRQETREQERKLWLTLKTCQPSKFRRSLSTLSVKV